MTFKGWAVVGVVTVLGVALGATLVRRHAVDSREYRIGFENEPPFHFPDAQGRPTGLAVDILNEAAQRSGIRLRWSFESQSSEMALRSGAVDLWPIMTIRPERLPYVHFTQPYRESEACLLVRAERPYRVPADLDGKEVWYSGLPMTAQLIARILPNAKARVLDDARGLVETVCRGEADAAYLDEFTVIDVLMNGAPCAGVRLRAINVPSARGTLGIGATFEAAGVADRLRGTISDMYEDGTLSLLIARWTYFTGRSMEQSSALLQAQRREYIMAAAIAGTALLFVLAAFLAWRTRQQSLRAMRAEAERSKLKDQLQQSQRLESIGRLAGGVAHDFNNLLTVINGYAELLEAEEGLTDDQKAQVAQIAEAGGQASNLTQQLLAFSRKQVIQPVSLQLNAVVEGIAPMLRRLVGEDIELTTTFEPNLASVMADPAQVHQVLLNLVVNSRDAMPRGGRLRIDTANVVVDEADAALHPGARPGPHVMLAVSDTGTGIDRDVLAHIFEPFFTTKGKGEGTGLGLAMVYGVVQQSHGWITVSSEPGAGTTIRIYLPPAEGHGEAPTSDRTHPARATGTETILIVEDQASVRHLAVSVLQQCGYQLLEAESGEDALRVASARPAPIHLLLTDVVLPGMTGKDLAEQLQAARPGMKVLYASGYAEDVIVHHGVVNPGIRFLPKPYPPHVLAAKVREVLDQASG
jgi:signal transduction histidine kinase/ActR/RegA family two-component response regulator